MLKYGAVPRLPSGKIDRKEYSKMIRRSKGIRPKPPSKYGVPRLLPDGRSNPKYQEAISRAKGVRPQSFGWSKYGVRSTLPNGRPNPKWAEAARRAQGVKPLKRWNGRCTDCKSLLVVGENWRWWQKECGNHLCIKCSIDRQTKFRRKKGMRPQGSKYGVPRRLSNGKTNPKWTEAFSRARGVKPHPQNWGNTYGVPYKLSDGRTNPEWRRRHAQNPRIQLGMKKHQAKRQRGLPTTIIFGHRFRGLVLHHMSPNVGIWIPEAINKIPHNIWTGKNMDKVNKLALKWYFDQWYK